MAKKSDEILKAFGGDDFGTGETPTQSARPQSKVSAALMSINAMANIGLSRQFEVNLPILGESVIMEPIKNAEDLRLNTLRSTGVTFLKSFNEILFSHAKFPEDSEIKTLDAFYANITNVDKNVLTYGLLCASFNELPERQFTCPMCSKPSVIDLKPERMLKYNTVKRWDKDVKATEYVIKKEAIPGILEIHFGIPTEGDKILLLGKTTNDELRKSLETNGSVLNTLETIIMVIKRIDVKTQDGKVITLTNKLTDIYEFIMNADLNLQQKIVQSFKGVEFGIDIPEFGFDIACEHCGHIHEWSGLDPETEFFRQIASLY
jgi:hypothetical protein